MKLRIQANSIRFRITPTELHTLATRGSVESYVQLGLTANDRLRYALETSPENLRPEVKYSRNAIRVMLPENAVREWASTAQVGIEAVQTVADNANLKILIEKDFKCLQPRGDENEADRFPNPAELTHA